jgi:hypothetical protein
VIFDNKFDAEIAFFLQSFPQPKLYSPKQSLIERIRLTALLRENTPSQPRYSGQP